MDARTSAPAVARACELSGSQQSLADLISAPAAQVSQWVSGSRPVPVKYCLAIERATDGKVTRADLRPEDFWLIWPDLPAPTAQEVAHG